MLTLEEVENKIFEAGNKLGLNNDSILYPRFSKTSQVFSEGTTIYISDSKYHFITMDRGQVRKHIYSKDIDVILYELFKNITANLARKFELENRKENIDSRRIWWKKQLELLDTINPSFFIKRKKEMDDILKISPFRDM